MTIKLKSVTVDLDREDNGGWQDSTAYPGVRYRVRGLNYRPYQEARDEAAERLSKTHKTSRPEGDEARKITGKLTAEHLLLEWEGFDVSYTREAAFEILPNPEYRELLNDILTASGRVAMRDIEFLDDLGNVSPGTSATS